MYYIGERSPDAFMPQASTKRSNDEDGTDAQPKAKAKAKATASASASASSSSAVEKVNARARGEKKGEEEASATRVRKTIVKGADESEMARELKGLLNNRLFNVDDLRKKFRDTFAGINSIISIRSGRSIPISRASKQDIIDDYVDRLRERGALRNELKGVRDELERRRSASSPSEATVTLGT